MSSGFLSAEEAALGAAFLDQGYVIVPAEDRAGLDAIQRLVADLAAAKLGLPVPNAPLAFLGGIHERLEIRALNELRMHVYEHMNQQPWFRTTYHALVRNALASLVGNELAMQRRVNLSIQLPNDDSSLLPLHADVWAGDSAFEIVQWLPLVDVARSKSMFILPRKADAEIHHRVAEFARTGTQALHAAVEKDLVFLDIPYGSVLLFSQNLMHGNIVNREPDSRWSMNCRFKQVLTPYADKRLGEFFEPIIIRPVTRMGMEYKLPGGFEAS